MSKGVNMEQIKFTEFEKTTPGVNELEDSTQNEDFFVSPRVKIVSGWIRTRLSTNVNPKDYTPEKIKRSNSFHINSSTFFMLTLRA